jgi:hypothetical protein
MSEYSTEAWDWAAKSLLFAEWREMMATGHLTEAGLLAIRTRLDGGEFLAGGDLEAMRWNVDEAIAAGLGLDPLLMPGRAPASCPDDAAELDG